MRGIAPDTLISQVRNTAPFYYEAPSEWLARAPQLRPLLEPVAAEPSDLEYYRLCLAAHHGTVATFVPTDVDNQIRHRLWTGLPLETVRAQAGLVLESRRWNCRPYTERYALSPVTGDVVSGHNGEWFSTAAGAYGALRSRDPELAATVAAEIRSEVELEARVFGELVSDGDGLNALRACAMIAHNMGDLARVVEMWGLERDPVTDFGRTGNVLIEAACELYKAKMAPENHRHLSLRKPRALRRSVDFLLPCGPFFDEWGMKLARHPQLAPEDLAEIVEALVAGLDRTPGSVGYTRALAGIEACVRGGAQGLQNLLPARTARALKAGPLRLLISQPRGRFEQQWSSFALSFCKAFSRFPVRVGAPKDTASSSRPYGPPHGARPQ